MIANKIPKDRSVPPHTSPTPHGPDDVNSPATQFTSSHDDTMNSAPESTKQLATVT
jgi:hypothetical protein